MWFSQSRIPTAVSPSLSLPFSLHLFPTDSSIMERGCHGTSRHQLPLFFLLSFPLSLALLRQASSSARNSSTLTHNTIGDMFSTTLPLLFLAQSAQRKEKGKKRDIYIYINVYRYISRWVGDRSSCRNWRKKSFFAFCL